MHRFDEDIIDGGNFRNQILFSAQYQSLQELRGQSLKAGQYQGQHFVAGNVIL